MTASEPQPQRRSPWLAGLANLFCAPLGHIYAGQAWRGIRLYLAFTAISFGTIYLAAQPVGVVGLIIVVLTALAGVLGLIVDAVLVARRQGSVYRLKGYNRWYVYLAAFIAIQIFPRAVVYGMRTYLAQAYFLPSGAMAPTLLEGDRFLVDNLALRLRPPRRGEIVVFRAPPQASPDEMDFTKRVIGIAGDMVAIEPDAVTVDGKTAVQMINSDAVGDYASFLHHRSRGLAVTKNSTPVSRQGTLEVATPDGHVTVVASPTGTVTFHGRRVLVDGVERATLLSPKPGHERHTLAGFGADAGVKGTVVLNGDEPLLIVLKGSQLALRPGRVLVNERGLQEPYVDEAPRYEMPPYRVPDGHLFVLGDNRNDSNDSHAWGPLDQKRVSGVVRTLYFSWDEKTATVRWERIGTHLK
jgi:signal peptidase I